MLLIVWLFTRNYGKSGKRCYIIGPSGIPEFRELWEFWEVASSFGRFFFGVSRKNIGHRITEQFHTVSVSSEYTYRGRKYTLHTEEHEH